MMDNDYANRMLITDLLLFGLLFFVIFDGLRNYEPQENMNTPATEQILDTETDI